MGDTKFHLCKWYADCVTDDGETIIGYVADLTWRGLELKYSSLLHTSADGTTTSRTDILNVPSPENSPSEFTWRSPGLDFGGAWTSRQSAISKTLYDIPDGSISWECLQPLSAANLTFNGRQIAGLGYVERLDLTLPPWKLPISRLHWGRFLASDRSVIWIDWQGEHPLRHAWIDGTETSTADVADFQLHFTSGSRLVLQQDAVLRDGVIGESVLHVIPKWFGQLPGRVLGIHEQKWRSRGTLLMADQEPVEGWAIHEVVQWPR